MNCNTPDVVALVRAEMQRDAAKRRTIVIACWFGGAVALLVVGGAAFVLPALML